MISRHLYPGQSEGMQSMLSGWYAAIDGWMYGSNNEVERGKQKRFLEEGGES